MSNVRPGLLPREPLHRVVLLACAAAVCLHQLPLWSWYIEDAAISFAYARNLVQGEGLVPFPRGERVEGFSNPTWVALTALFELMGVDGFSSAKWLGLGFAALCVPFPYAMARRALPAEAVHYALIAPIVLALTSMFAIWSTSGLENSLMCFLLAGGAWQLSREMEDGGFPWSAVWFVLAASTRPDGILYAAMAGGLLLFTVLRARWRHRAGDGPPRSLTPVLGWVALFWIPYLAMISLRLWYFAYPLPTTYYAKVGGGGTMMHRWQGYGWQQLRGYCVDLGQVVFLPIYLFGASGLRDRRGLAMAAVVALFALHLLVPGPDWLRASSVWPELPEPDAWLKLRVGMVGAMGLALPFVPVGTPRWAPRSAAVAMAVVSVFFHLYSNADWMTGYRWMSLLAPTSAVLFAVGVYEVGAWLHRQLPQVPIPDRLIAPIAVVTIASFAVPNLAYTRWYAEEGRSEDPFMIQRRGHFSLGLWRRLNLQHRPMTYVDHDMGGHMFWFGETHELVDVAGLVDVPRARHNFGQTAFVEEYFFREKRPDLVHLSKNWQGWSGFPRRETFAREWVPVPPRNGPWNEHIGFWLRRDLLFQPAWQHPTDRKVNFAGGASLQGWDIPNPELGRGRAWLIEVGVKASPRKPGDDFRMVAFLTRGDRPAVVWDLPLGHGIVPMHAWRADETFVGRFALELPTHVAEGTYDLGLAVLGPAGHVLPAGGLDGKAYVAAGAIRPERPAFARGEVRFPDAVRVVDPTRSDALADQKRHEALQLAGRGSCDAAEALWLRAQQQVPKNYAWQDRQRPEVARALAGCWVAMATDAPADQVAHLARAHRWDHRAPAFLEAVQPVADALYAAGLSARADEDWDAAYEAFHGVLRIQPTRAWARRYAEEARDRRLGYPSLGLLGRFRRAPPQPKPSE